MDVAAVLTGLDPEQLAAVTERSSPLVIIAAAGSGKTTVLTRRIAHRILVDPDVHAQHVLALTFTSQAARELQRRLRRVGLRDRVEAGTFHAIALRLLRQRATDNGQPLPMIAADRVRLMVEAMTAAGLSAPRRDEAAIMLADIDWCRARLVDTSDARLALRKAGRRITAGQDRLAAVADAFTLVKKRRGVVDFDDLLEMCLHTLRTDALWAAGVRWRFRHLFVDEAQDLNPAQHALLEAIRGDRSDVCLVGDPRQAIFGFNGADPEIMNSIERLYPGITIVRLVRNYRCTPQIIAAGSTVLGAIGQHDDSVAVAADGSPVVVRSAADEAAESTLVVTTVRELAGIHRPWRSCAVLARTGAQLTEVARALDVAGVPSTTHGRSGTRSALGAALAEAFAQRNSVDLVTWVERVTGEAAADPVKARVAEAADRYVAQRTGLTFRAWVDLHSPFEDLEDSEPDDAVELLTFHGAKGREWPSVIVVGVETGLMPHGSAVTVSQRDEEARLLYVACTRAREQLVLTWAAQRHGRSAQQSPLIEAIGHDESIAVSPPLALRTPRPTPDPVYTALVEWRHNAARAAQVEPHTICSDESLRAVAQARPRTVEAVAALTDLGPLAAARVAPRLLAALNRAV